MIRPIIQVPSLRLRMKSQRVKQLDADTAECVQDLLDTLRAHTLNNPDMISLAANQIGYKYKIFALKHPELGPEPMAFINPRVYGGGSRRVYCEACASMKDVEVMTERTTEVLVQYQDPQTWKAIHKYLRTCELAFAAQHSQDHLNGLLITSRRVIPR